MGGAAPTWTVRSTGTARTVSATVAHRGQRSRIAPYWRLRSRGCGVRRTRGLGPIFRRGEARSPTIPPMGSSTCLSLRWHPNSRVVHATSPTAEGPYTRVQVVLGHYAHGPSVARDPVTGTWVLTHLGTGLPDPTPRPIPGVAGVTLHYCVNGNSYNTSNKSYPTIPGLPPPPPPPPPSPLPLPLLPAGSEWMLFADSPFGPWRNGIKAPNPGANSVPLFYPNGSVLVAQQGLSKSGPTNCTAGVPGGCTNGSGFLNWVYAESVAALENGDFVAHGAADITVTPWTHWEDVFMWVDQIG